jgi:hypothetical protein
MTRAINFAAIAVGISALIAAGAYAHHIHHVQTAETDVQTFEWAGVTYLVATGQNGDVEIVPHFDPLP